MDKYKKIINRKHHISVNRPKMSLLDRAAQFSPFDALTGYKESIKETSRLTDKKIELSDEDKEVINNLLLYIINNNIKENIEVVYFVPDSKKDGGKYINYIGSVRIINTVEQNIYFNDGKIININDVIKLNICK